MTRSTQPRPTLRRDSAEVLEQDLGWHSRLAARHLSAALDRRLHDTGLSSTQFTLMCLVAATPDDTLGALAQRAGVNQSTMSRTLDGLARLGWVEIAMVQEDRRRRAVWLTESGARTLAAAMKAWRDAHRELSARVNAKLAIQLSAAATALAPEPSPTAS